MAPKADSVVISCRLSRTIYNKLLRLRLKREWKLNYLLNKLVALGLQTFEREKN